MPPGTLERSAPSMFKQGPSPRARWALYSALALFLMVADARFHLTNTLRQTLAAMLYPVQWTMLQPVELARQGHDYIDSLQTAQREAQQARRGHLCAGGDPLRDPVRPPAVRVGGLRGDGAPPHQPAEPSCSQKLTR